MLIRRRPVVRTLQESSGDTPAGFSHQHLHLIPTGLGHLRNALVARADAVIAIGGGAGTLTEIALAWLYRRLIVALRVDGWSGELADRRVDERIRHPTIPDDRVFGASDATEAVGIVSMRIESYARSEIRTAR